MPLYEEIGHKRIKRHPQIEKIEQHLTKLELLKNPFFAATLQDDAEQIKALVFENKSQISQQNHNGETALIMAAKHGKFNVVQTLIKLKAGGNLANYPFDTLRNNANMKLAIFFLNLLLTMIYFWKKALLL